MSIQANSSLFEKLWEQGFDAFWNGIEYENNPYMDNHEDVFGAWNQGWQDAELGCKRDEMFGDLR